MEQPKAFLTPEEYLEIERKAEFKSEFLNGEKFALVGNTKEHNTISFNISGILYNQLLSKPCRAYHSDLRVKINPTGLYTYPDIVVTGEEKFEDNELDTLLNPTLIIEILSKTTEDYDRGTKFKHYRQIESLKEYVIVSQTNILVEKYLRQEDNPMSGIKWIFSEEHDPEKSVELTSLNCLLPLKSVYLNVEFENKRNKN